jgi:NRPS condensation-like uncharacterized protein
MKRALTGLERALWLRGVFSTNIIVIAKISGSIQAAELRQAWLVLQEKHPLLAVHLEAKGPELFFTSDGCAAIPVREVAGEGEESWQDVGLDEQDTPFLANTGQPLLRSVLLHLDDAVFLIICGHHAICDALALTFLVRDLLYCLSGQQELVKPSADIVFDNSMVPSTVTVPWWLKALLVPANFLFGKIIKPLADPAAVSKERINMLYWEISQEQTAALHKACRRNKVSEHSALTALFQAAQYYIQGDGNKIYQQVYTPVSVRNRLNTKVGTDFGMYASDAYILCRYNPDQDFWQNARQFHLTIKESITDQTMFGKILLAGLVHPHLLDRIMVRALNNIKVQSGYILSNLGRLKMPVTYGRLTLEGFRGPLGYIIQVEKMLAVVSINGKYSITLGHRPTVISLAELTRIRDKAMALLAEYTDGA